MLYMQFLRDIIIIESISNRLTTLLKHGLQYSLKISKLTPQN